MDFVYKKCSLSFKRSICSTQDTSRQKPNGPWVASAVAVAILHIYHYLPRVILLFCSWISFFGLPIKSYSGLRPLVYNKYTLKEPDSRLRPIGLLGVWKTPRINKIKLDLDSGLERPTTINTRTTFQSKTEPSRKRKRKESAESNQKKLWKYRVCVLATKS